ncbi:phosphoribosylformylglycinamidine synthase I [Candidatus Woesearchaeota archaeon]|nr:phosphoribosylformylglycinamidine synthase I [Candidatus Woesearchaeota archaeon]
MVKALILRSAGTNCNDETEYGFKLAGAQTEQVHVNELIAGTKKLADYDILALPGGFSYGDYIAAGTILANQLNMKLKAQIEQFAEEGKTIIGICNGFQVLVRTGLLPGNGKAMLTNNDSGKFECRWVKLRGTGKIKELYLPVAHGEGKFSADEETLEHLEENSQILFKYAGSRYPDNPNGSLRDVAGITNKKGNVIGIMPHPERNLTPQNYPGGKGEGLQVFKNIVEQHK